MSNNNNMASKPKTKFRSVRKKSSGKNTTSPKQQEQESSSIITSPSSSLSMSPSSHLRISGPHKRNPSQSVMVRLKRLDTLRLNQRIKVKDYGYGTIQFLGCVHFAQGLFVGVELDEAMGKHDGSYHGKRYFTAKDKHGVLVKQHRVELLDVDDSQNNDNDEFDLNELSLQEQLKHIKKKQSIHYDEFLFDEAMMNDIDDSKSNHREDSLKGGREGKIGKIKELTLKNQVLNDKIEEYMTSQDDLEEKIRNLENENLELKQEKLHFENEMNTKIEELEDQLEQIRLQLQTKDQVLKKQISNHENTKIKFRKKIKEHEELKQKNQDIVQLILYGDKSKDDIIFELKKKDKKYLQEKQEYILEMERINIQTEEKLNKKIQEWIFDYQP